MKTKIKLTVYPSIELPVIYKKLTEAEKVNCLSKIAFTPADNLTLEVIRNLKYHENIQQKVFVYDKDFMKDFPYKVYAFDDAKNHRPDKIFILSAMHNKKIEEVFLSLGVEKDTLINPYKDDDDLLTVGKALDLMFSLNDDKNTDYLYSLMGEDSIVIINCPVFIYDIYEKINILQNNLQMKIVFLDTVLQPEIDTNNGTVRANAVDVINYIRVRNNKSNIIFLSTHFLWRLVILQLMRTAFPDIKILAYIYDWIHLFCPYEHKRLMQKFLKLPIDYIESEYRVLELLLEGKIADGVIHKDGGNEFPVLRDYPLPKLFFPTYMRRSLYREPIKHVENPNKFVFMGTIYSSISHMPELFDDVFLYEVFNDVAKQDFTIDVYYVRSSEETVKKYKEIFKTESRVRMIKGKPLNELFPEIAGKYHWGWMIYKSNFAVVRKHVEFSLPSKIFAYLALGLPIVISEELQFSADFIEANKIGVVVAKKDIANIKEVLRGTDYHQLQRNVLEFRERMCLDRHEDELVNFFHGIKQGV